MESMAAFGAIFALIYGIVMFIVLGFSIWSFVLFVKLANRGIKALDIYNRKNGDNNMM